MLGNGDEPRIATRRDFEELVPTATDRSQSVSLAFSTFRVNIAIELPYRLFNPYPEFSSGIFDAFSKLRILESFFVVIIEIDEPTHGSI